MDISVIQIESYILGLGLSLCVCFLLVTLSPKAKKLLYRYILLDYIGISAGDVVRGLGSL